MRKLVAILGLIAAPAFAQDDAVDPAVVEQINAMLTGMSCEVDPINIEKDGEGFELDDVFCADGQYDIKLDAAMAVTEKRKE